MKDIGIKLTIDNRVAKSEAEEVQDEVKKVGDEAEKAGKKVDKKLGGGFKEVKKSILSAKNAVTGLVAIVTTGTFARMGMEALKASDHIAKTADKLGLTTDRLQEYRYHAGQSGIDIRRFDMAFQRFGRRIAEVANDQGELLKTAKQYNLQVKTSEGHIRDINHIFAEYADLIKNASSDQEALRLAFKAFDSEGAVMVNMLREGSKGLREYQEEAQRLGLVIEEDLLRGSENAVDALDDLKKQLQATFSRAILANADLIVAATETIGDQLVAMGRHRELSRQIDELFEERPDFFNWLERGWERTKMVMISDVEDLEKLLDEMERRLNTAETGIMSPRQEETILRYMARTRRKLGVWKPPVEDTGDDEEDEKVPQRLLQRKTTHLEEWREKEKKNWQDYWSWYYKEEYGTIVTASENTLSEHQQMMKKFREADAKSWQEADEAIIAHKYDTTEKIKETWNDLAEKTKNVSHEMSDAFAEFATGGEIRIRDMVDTMIKDMLRFVSQKFMFGPMMEGIAGLFSSSHAGGDPMLGPKVKVPIQHAGTNPILAPKVTVTPNIKVPVFHSGLKANEYMAVLEKGESVNTKEEVRAGSGGPGLNVVINNYGAPENVSVEQQKGRSGIDQLMITVAENVGKRGVVARAFEGKYGVKPVGRRV